MFKSKVDFNAFDLKNEKVKNVEETKIKALSKNAVKKVLKNPEVRTPFYLILDYFKDKANKPLTHFLCFGINKKMDKHFEQVEMKSGKLDKSMSASQKEASMGEVYCKEEGGKKLLCFEPSAKSKIQKGKWPKILKTLKPFLAGAKAVVIIDGAMVGEDTDLLETTEQAPSSDQTGDTANLMDQFKAQLEAIAVSLKETLPKEIIPKLKSRTVEAIDLETVNAIKDNINTFEAAYQEATESVQNKLTKMRDSIVNQVPKVEQLVKAIEGILGSTGPNSVSEEDTSTLEALLKLATQSLNDFDKNYDQLKTDLETATPVSLPSGDQFIEQL
ncbi:MAG: hypothetical protein ACRBFS_15725 [Aureispira sp.]